MEIQNGQDPTELLINWIEEAKLKEINDPEAMALSTVSDEGTPSVRMVLLRKIDKEGLVFFTNYNSRKAKEIKSSPKAAMCIHWKSIRKQVRAVGVIEKTSGKESDEYYNSRHIGSRIGAWASKQSQVLFNKNILNERVSEYKKKFSEKEPPRPEFWGGYRLVPKEFEFWSDGEYRLHDRFVFLKEDKWNMHRLYP